MQMKEKYFCDYIYFKHCATEVVLNPVVRDKKFESIQANMRTCCEAIDVQWVGYVPSEECLGGFCKYLM